MFKNIVVGISGGVDSAVAALLLKRKGYNITGVFMKNWDITNEVGECLAEKDFADAQHVCDILKIPLHQVNFVKDYWNNVFSDLLEKYEIGYTPNPDILCNKYIKFDRFLHIARERFHADAIATGHYVRTNFGPYLERFKTDTNVRLLQAHDVNKDQTFFLSQVPQKALRYCMFPVGTYLKTDVKKIAREAGLHKVVQKKESMGICFIGKREFRNFIGEYIENKSGDFIDLETGAKLGQHNGTHQWTIGQRCGISGQSMAYYVTYKDMETNNIFIVKGLPHPALSSDLLILKDPHWIVDEPLELRDCKSVLNCYFRFQHRQPLVTCSVYNSRHNDLIIKLDKPLQALTRGQYAILYSGEECLGSGMISAVGPSYFMLKREYNETSSDDGVHDVEKTRILTAKYICDFVGITLDYQTRSSYSISCDCWGLVMESYFIESNASTLPMPAIRSRVLAM